MSGAAAYLGGHSIGDIVPALETNINLVLPQVQAQVDGITQAQLSVSLNPPTIASSIAMLQALLPQLLAALALPIPAIAVSIGGPLLQLEVTLQALNAQLGLLGAAGIDLYAYSGDVGSMGNAIGAATIGGLPSGGGGPSQQCNALLIATSSPTAWAALSQIMKTA
jgi:hypothetical protein